MLIDTHVNLHSERFDEDRDAVIEHARAAGVGAMIAICARFSEFDAVKAVSEPHADIWRTVGAHPHHAKDRPDVTADEIAKIADDPRVVAIGETGLDNHYGYSPIEAQEASFRAHICAARLTGLPLIVHTREADERTAEILEEETEKGAFPILLHCYTGGRDLARRGAALGAYFSVNGIMTFKNASDVRDVIVAEMPEDRIILETDAPYLAPVPHRGRRNEPAFLVHVRDKLAELKGWSPEETEERTARASGRLFEKIAATVAAS